LVARKFTSRRSSGAVQVAANRGLVLFDKPVCSCYHPTVAHSRRLPARAALFQPCEAYMTDILIRNGAVLTLTGERAGILNPGYLAITGNRIAALGAGAPPEELVASAATVIDAANMAVMPGMVNAHSHLFQTFIRGLADDKTLLPWLAAAIWPVGQTMSAEEAYLSGLLGLVENIRSGATTVIDNQYLHCDDATDAAFCRAAADTGVRFMIARGWADRNYHPAFQETPDQVVDAMTRLYEMWDGEADGRIRVAFGPLIPWGCSESTLQRTVELARKWGVPTHIHTAETREEVQMSVDATGLRHVEWLDKLGVLGPDVHIVHAVWLDDHEIARVAETGTTVVHCPVSNAYLASGIARVKEMIASGVTVALATDGPGSNNSQDMLETLKFAACLQKVGTLDPTALLPEDVLRMACVNGARAFAAGAGKMDDGVASVDGATLHSHRRLRRSLPSGTLEVGAQADVVLVDLDSPRMQPVWRVPSALVYNANGGDVDTVIVAGRVLMRDRKSSVSMRRRCWRNAVHAGRKLVERAGHRACNLGELIMKRGSYD
jgi:5-methylthioadenosine/S-adenosylhomocysteine deaminase